MDRGLSATEPLWPDVRRAFAWVHRAAEILSPAEAAAAASVRRRLQGLLGAMSRHRGSAGTLESAAAHFLKVTRSYWPGLFHCYESAGLPRTNNDLERFFGSHRYHERRASGRKAASPGLVLRGSARLLASAATRRRTCTARDLAGADRTAWRQFREQLDERRRRRTGRTRFRRDTQAFLNLLEQQLLQPALPA